MKYHPAVLMLLSWGIAFAVFFIMPFSLESRTMTLYGYLILLLFIATFCVGALSAARPMPQAKRNPAIVIDFGRADRVLMVVCTIAILMFILDVQGRNLFDLADAYQKRSVRADGLLQGSESESTIWFQIGFLTYPASYVYLVREIGFKARPLVWKVAVFGFAPVVLASLAMGGRAPLLFVIIFAVFAYNVRKQVFSTRDAVRGTAGLGRMPGRAQSAKPKRTLFRLGVAPKAGAAILAGVAMVYFVQVFLTRAQGAGGADAMFGVADLNWGVGFNGRFSSVFYSTLGVEGTYLVFVFAWYAIQGIVMSNTIFSGYDGPMLMGTYGVDLVSAAMRRLNGEFVADGFGRLLHMNVYGFLPTAFGSLYVDLKFFGLIPCLGWGWLCGLIYRKIKTGADPRYLMLAPFVSFGVVFSLINTPIGLSNGLVLHFWLVLVFMLSTTNAGHRGKLKPTRPRPRIPGFAR
jgi:hypothetical protein